MFLAVLLEFLISAALEEGAILPLLVLNSFVSRKSAAQLAAESKDVYAKFFQKIGFYIIV